MENIDVEKYVGKNKLVLVELRNGTNIKGQIINYSKKSNSIEFRTLKKTSFINLDFVLLIEVIIENFVPNRGLLKWYLRYSKNLFTDFSRLGRTVKSQRVTNGIFILIMTPNC